MKRSHRHVAVILQTDVADVGFADELVDVRAGFARNFLLQGGLAVVATPIMRTQHEAKIAKAAAKREAEVAERRATAAKLEAEPVQLKLKVGPGGQVFGSITASDLVTAIKSAHKVVVTTSQISSAPLKALGGHTVSVKLGPGVNATVNVEIVADKAKAEQADDSKTTEETVEPATA